MNRFERTKLIFGDRADELFNKHVIVFGVGGVGSYVIEALARSCIGKLTIVDNDVVSISNINRQLIALESTVGMKKVEVAKARVLDINPSCEVIAKCEFVTADNAADFFCDSIDYVVDAIDNITAKLKIAEIATKHNLQIISCMGTGNKLDASKFQITDISKTHTCPLARIMRAELRKRNIEHLQVLFSTEQAIKPQNTEDRTPGSVSFVPSVAGLLIAGKVVKDLVDYKVTE